MTATLSPHQLRDGFPNMEEERRLTAGGWVKDEGYDLYLSKGGRWKRVTASGRKRTLEAAGGGRWSRVTASGRKQTLEAAGEMSGALMTDDERGVHYRYGPRYHFTVTDSLDTAYDPHAFEEKTETFEQAMNWADSQTI